MGELFHARKTILTTGTFLQGVIHVGDRNYSAGRAGDFAAQGLSGSLSELGLRFGPAQDWHLSSVEFTNH